MIIAQACGSGTRPLVLATAEHMAYSIGAMILTMEQQIEITSDKKVSCITAAITTTIMLLWINYSYHDKINIGKVMDTN
jgi:hypothetical protein